MGRTADDENRQGIRGQLEEAPADRARHAGPVYAAAQVKREIQGARLGYGEPEASARCVDRACQRDAELRRRLRDEEAGESRATPHRHGDRLGGNPESVARYLNVTPKLNDGKTIYKLHVPADVPVNAFWSVSLYDADGHSGKIRHGEEKPDRSVDIQFGGCDRKIANCLPIMNGWNDTVRLYRPRVEILNGTWVLPKAQRAQ